MNIRLLLALAVIWTGVACQTSPQRPETATEAVTASAKAAKSTAASEAAAAGAVIAGAKGSAAAHDNGLFPPRKANAVTGRQFLEKTRGLSAMARERAIVAEIISGNVPSHVRHLSTVTLGYAREGGKTVKVTARVLPDYLAIGSDSDFVHIPMQYDTARMLAETLGMALPTTKIVKSIYQQATLKLKPQPLPACREMVTNAYYLRHAQLLEAQIARRAPTGLEGLLVAGHKKDVVASKRLVFQPDRLAIFGWHQMNSEPIQPLSLAHERDYADYSHGIRLIDDQLLVGDHKVPLAQAFNDPQLMTLVSDEGRFASYPQIAAGTTKALRGSLVTAKK